MNVREGRRLDGPAGTAVEVIATEHDVPDWQASVAVWFLDCPGQSPAWRHYSLAAVHLRPIEGVKPAVVTVAGATHEVLLVALDPKTEPTPTGLGSWRMLHPVNVCEQITVPDDAHAAELLFMCAKAVVAGVLPAEPALAGAREPWHTSLIKTSAHVRGEEHAP